MDQAEFELKLKVWKDMAIGKQILISAATEALGLPPECTADEIKAAFEETIKKGQGADALVNEARERADAAVFRVEKAMKANEREKAAAEAARDEALAALQNSEQQAAAARASSARELEQVKAQVIEKDRALKAINVALADTPKNVIKKLKELKKQKMDESNARKRAESENRSLRKQKQELEQRLEDAQTLKDNGVKLADQYRELHQQCAELIESLRQLDKSTDLPDLPELDTQLLESFAQAELGEGQGKLASVA